MSSTHPLLVWFILLLAVPLLAVASDAPALLGVELDSTYLRTAYFNNTEPVPVVCVTGSRAYQDYMADTLTYEGPPQYVRDSTGEWAPAREEKHDDAAAVEIFKRALSEALEHSLHVMEQPTDIGTIGIPNHFNDTSRQAVLMALDAVHPKLETWPRIKYSNLLGLLTYPQNNCVEQYRHSFGRAQAILVEVMPWGPAYDGSDIVVAFNVEDLLQQGIPDLIDRERSHIQAVIFSGSISASETSAVEQVIGLKFPELLSKIQGGVSVSAREYVKATGAACSARGLDRHPEFLEGLDADHGFRLPTEHHDEL